jgi:hypothetical protein
VRSSSGVVVLGSRGWRRLHGRMLLLLVLLLVVVALLPFLSSLLPLPTQERPSARQR